MAKMKKTEKIVSDGITFDDVLLLPRYSEITPDMVNLKAKLTKHITLNVPLISAAMDTVTESEMAIALAREGGIGIIHKNMTADGFIIPAHKKTRYHAQHYVGRGNSLSARRHLRLYSFRAARPCGFNNKRGCGGTQ